MSVSRPTLLLITLSAGGPDEGGYARKSTEQKGVANTEKSVARLIAHAREYAARKGRSSCYTGAHRCARAYLC
jgi:hypothetical protein